MLSGMKVIKLYAWEAAFEEKIEKLRKEEVRDGICFTTFTYSASVAFYDLSGVYIITNIYK